jgi:hypothetical protein
VKPAGKMGIAGYPPRLLPAEDIALRGFYGNISLAFAMSMGDDGERGEQVIGFRFDNLVVQVVGK